MARLFETGPDQIGHRGLAVGAGHGQVDESSTRMATAGLGQGGRRPRRIRHNDELHGRIDPAGVGPSWQTTYRAPRATAWSMYWWPSWWVPRMATNTSPGWTWRESTQTEGGFPDEMTFNNCSNVMSFFLGRPEHWTSVEAEYSSARDRRVQPPDAKLTRARWQSREEPLNNLGAHGEQQRQRGLLRIMPLPPRQGAGP